MAPRFLPDDYVITFAWRGTRYRRGDVVVAQHPLYRTVIKRIAAVNTGGEVLLSGDSPASVRSDSLGWLPGEDLLGRVVWHICASAISR